MLGNFSCFCRLFTFFKIYYFQKILSGTLSECQTVWIQIRTDIWSVLIWFPTVCKGYQWTTKVDISKEELIIGWWQEAWSHPRVGPPLWPCSLLRAAGHMLQVCVVQVSPNSSSSSTIICYCGPEDGVLDMCQQSDAAYIRSMGHHNGHIETTLPWLINFYMSFSFKFYLLNTGQYQI